jgi:subfamily B ATP-binding cassette protein HlyB/CyaB
MRSFPFLSRAAGRYREIWAGNNILTIIDLPFSFLYLGIIYILSPVLFLLALIFVCIHTLVCVCLTRQSAAVERDERDVRGTRDLFVNKLGSIWGGLYRKSDRLKAVDGWFEEEFSLGQIKFSYARWNNYLAIWISSFPLYSTVGITLAGSLLIVDGGLSIGGLIAVNMVAARVYGPVLGATKILTLLTQCRSSVAQMGSIMDAATPLESVGKEPLAQLRSLAFSHVSAEGQSQYEKLNNVSISFEADNVYALTGEADSGIDQFIDSLFSLNFLTQGNILINEIPIRQLPFQELIRTIDLVTNYPALVGGSVRDHLGDISTVDPELLSNSMKVSGLNSFIKIIPDGVDSLISSINQKYRRDLWLRVCLCKCLLYPKNIMILDVDPLALNPFDFDRLISELLKLKKGRVIIFRTNREDVARHCDLVVMFSNGEIMGKGTFDDLMLSKESRKNR